MSPPRKRKSGARKKRKPDAEAPKAAAPAPEDAARVGPLLRWTLGVAGLFVVLALLLLLLVYPTTKGPMFGRSADIEVGGQSAGELADLLADRGLVDNPRYFAIYLRARGGVASLAKGSHFLPDHLSPRELVNRLQRHDAERVKVAIPEGWTRFDIARRLEALWVCRSAKFLAATEDPALRESLHVEGPTLEGYLFPATYDLPRDGDPRELVKRMVTTFQKRYMALEEKHQSGLADLTTSLGWGRREIVILASMVEKEAAVDEERPLIASVFLNRMRDASFTPKLLQCDPTAGYGCLVGDPPGCAEYDGKVTHALVADAQNPYNTYKHEGLPPGPICSPGARSLEAVMDPAITSYLYFVAKGARRHTFSATLSAHNAAVHKDAGVAP